MSDDKSTDPEGKDPSTSLPVQLLTRRGSDLAEARLRLTRDNEEMIDLLRGLAVIVGIFLMGNWLHAHGVPIPGGMLGLLLLFGAMLTRAIKLRWVERAASLLLRHMVLLFVPLTVGLMSLGPVLSRQAGAILASLAVSFLAVLLTTGLLARWLLHPNEVAQGAETESGR